jgi:hypothetical protein
MATSTKRRAFLRGSAAAAAAFGIGGSPVKAQSASQAALPAAAKAPGDWRPARHDKDNWLDLPGVHKLVFDTTSPEATAEAAQYAGNFFSANKEDYGVEAKDLAVVICLRHDAAPMGYSDAMWAKYGAILGEALKLTDPQTGQAPVRNLRGRGFTRLIDQGAHFAVCATATRRFAGVIARKVGGTATADSINKELISNLLPNAHMVAAGIIAVNRAQERGFTLCSC